MKRVDFQLIQWKCIPQHCHPLLSAYEARRLVREPFCLYSNLVIQTTILYTLLKLPNTALKYLRKHILIGFFACAVCLHNVLTI